MPTSTPNVSNQLEQEGTSGPDLLVGGDGADTLKGLGDSDLLIGGAGDDRLVGDGRFAPLEDPPDAGSDLLLGGLGNDLLFGSSANDLLLCGSGNDEAVGGLGSDVLLGDEGDDVLLGSVAPSGGPFDHGGDLSDVVFGGSGNDFIDGGFGADALQGNDGADTLIGGRDADTMAGGSGDDVFAYNALFRGRVNPPERSGVESTPDAPDTILDFELAGEPGGDVIDLSRITSADSPVSDGPRSLEFIGTDAFSAGGPSDQLRFEQDAAAGTTLVQADFNADGAADFQIVLVGMLNLSAEDFVL